MINVIICDDNVMDANRIEKIVREYMYKLKYQIHLFHNYDRRFLNIIDSDLSNKIYLLDIETPSMSGIDVARKIRKKDYTSVIIFLTVHDELSRIVAKKNLMCLNFINKFDNLKDNLIKSLELALLVVGRKRIIRLSTRGIVYNIEIDRILYITRDTISRESIIVCDNKTYKIKLNLKDVVEELTSDFIQVHRSCYVNNNRVNSLDIKNMCITFDNEKTTNLVSKKYIERMVKK